MSAAPAAAQTTTLMPGVTYERGVQFTPHGPVAIHIVRGPRPTGLYALRPTLSNEAIQGVERVTSMQKRLSPGATMVGVNADFYADSGRPSGVLMRDNVVESPPYGDRSSTGVTPEGALDVRRIEFFGTWRGLGQRRTLNDLNQSPGTNGISLFTRTYGPATPVQPGVTEVVISPFPPTAPNTDLVGPVVQVASGGGTAIPQGGAVLVARGTAGQRLLEESPVGTFLTVRLIFRPEWTGVTNAVGGGPVLVRSGGPVFRAQEAFTSSQLAPRNPRTGVGQLADGRVLMVVTDGRRPGYSVGMTNFELAQTMVRLGAVTGSAFDGGGSSSLAFDGKLLNRPSDRGGERPVSNALQLMYYGVYSPGAGAGDLAERRRLRREAARALVQGRPALERDRDPGRARRRRRVHRDARCSSRGRIRSRSRPHPPTRPSSSRRRPPKGAGSSRSPPPTTSHAPRRRRRASRSTTRSASPRSPAAPSPSGSGASRRSRPA